MLGSLLVLRLPSDTAVRRVSNKQEKYQETEKKVQTTIKPTAQKV